MGYNTVAILLNDNIAFGADDPNLGKAIQSASREWSEREHDHLATRISTRSGNCIGAIYGQIISQDHADGYQVVVVHGNWGWRIDEAHNDKYLGYPAIDQMKDCLERNGYRVTKRRKQTEARAILATATCSRRSWKGLGRLWPKPWRSPLAMRRASSPTAPALS